MDDFKTIYRILKALDAGMDCDAPDPEAYSAEALGVSKNRRGQPRGDDAAGVERWTGLRPAFNDIAISI